MREISPRPWKLKDSYFIYDDEDKVICSSELDGFDNFEDAEFALKCVNEHDSLVAEIEDLQKFNDKLKQDLKFWQDRCVEAESKLYTLTHKYNQASQELHLMKVRMNDERDKI